MTNMNNREERITQKQAQLDAYKKHPLATIDIIFKLEYELQQIRDEILETPFQVIA